jgi:hypothetical protein
VVFAGVAEFRLGSTIGEKMDLKLVVLFLLIGAAIWFSHVGKHDKAAAIHDVDCNSLCQ